MNLLQQALDAIERVSVVDDDCDILSPSLTDAVDEAITDLRQAIEQGMVVVQGWRPIAEAPKDGTDVIVMYVHIDTQIVHNAFWIDADKFDDCESGWWTYTHSEISRELLEDWREPTHYMPLPPITQEAK